MRNFATALLLLALPAATAGCECVRTTACGETPCTAAGERFCGSNAGGCNSIYLCASRGACLVAEEEESCACSDVCRLVNGFPTCVDEPPPSDSGASDSGTPDSGATTDAGTSGPTLVVTYDDPCDCDPPPCCPTATFDFLPGETAAVHLMCGDAVACDPPPVGWEVMNAAGTWNRVVSPGESPGAGYLCTPATYVDPWINSVPMPPSGTVRAVGLFIDGCGPDPAACTASPCTGTPFEVTSNAFFAW